MPLSFDAATHSYFFDGIRIPSVTRVLDHSGIVSYDVVRREILERKSRIGTCVHLAAQYYDLDELNLSSVDDSIRGYFDGWCKFRRETGFVPRMIEERHMATVNGMQYGLTVDREGLLKNKSVILDIKTSANPEPWWAIQTAGYAMGVPDYDKKLASPRALFASRRRMSVQLFSDGSYKKFEFTDNRDAEVFISGLHISVWKMSVGENVRAIEAE